MLYTEIIIQVGSICILSDLHIGGMQTNSLMDTDTC